MKHIKQFEAYRRYKVNDYVFLNVKKIIKNLNNLFTPPSDVAKIIDVDYDRFVESPYVIQYPDGYEDAIKENEIKRLATLEEIKDVEYKFSANKYGI